MIDDIYEFSEAQGFEIDTIIQEGGAGQVEINLLHGDPLAVADQAFLFKYAAKEIAIQHGLNAVFMAKPIAGEPGSAVMVKVNAPSAMVAGTSRLGMSAA